MFDFWLDAIRKALHRGDGDNICRACGKWYPEVEGVPIHMRHYCTAEKALGDLLTTRGQLERAKSLIMRWAPMFCDHVFTCAVNEGKECDCGINPEDRKLFDAVMKGK